MNIQNIDDAMGAATDVVPSVGPCELATAFGAFLESLKPHAGFIGRFAIGMVQGKIREWRGARGCP